MASVARSWMDVRDDTAAFDRLFSREYSRLVGIAYRVLSDREEAEDVAQEVLCSFYGKHDPDAPYAAPWLYRATAHTALNAVRRERRRARREREAADGGARLQTETGLDPQQEVLKEESRAEVQRALARLPEKSASVLALRYSGLSYAEVAAALGVGVGQIGTLLRRAEVALKKELNRGTSE